MHEVWKKLNANMRQYVPSRGNMGQHCSLSAVQRKTAFVEQSWAWTFSWCRFAQEGLPRKHAFVDISVLGGWASNSQDSPKASPRVIFHRKNLTEQLKLILKWILIERWTRPSILSSMCQHVARLQFDSCAEKDSLCGTVMMAWIWHVWINAAKAPPKAGAKELSYNSLNLSMKDNAYYSGQHPCFGPNWFVQFCHPGSNPLKIVWVYHYLSPCKHQLVVVFSLILRGWSQAILLNSFDRHWTPVFFCGCASMGQDSPKGSPRHFSNERTW